MPSLARITNNFFVTLINRLGVRPPFTEGFELSNVVTPVSLVDSDISLSAISTTPTLGTPFTAGELVAPAINTVLADTLALPAGDYNVRILMMCGAMVAGSAADMTVQRRDAANAANIWSQRFGLTTTGSTDIDLTMRVTLANNERIRIINPVAVGAGFTVQASIWASV